MEMASDLVPELVGSQRPSPPVSSTSNRRVVCVFCGASSGNFPVHLEAARALARELHKNDISLVYGAGTTGIMGEIAKTLIELSGPSSVHGIVPNALIKHEQEGRKPSDAVDPVVQQIYERTTVVESMHTRKDMMAKEVMSGAPGSGFVALSGGFGTMEELMEITTWNQLGIHGRGIVVYNVDGYYDGLLQWINGAVDSGFITRKNSGILREARTAEEVVKLLSEYEVSPDRMDLDWEHK